MAKELICRFCGKVHLNLEGKTFKTQKEAEEYATLNCDCSNGEIYRNLTASLKDLNDFLQNSNFPSHLNEFFKKCALQIFNNPNDILIYSLLNQKIKIYVKKDKLKIEVIETNKFERTF